MTGEEYGREYEKNRITTFKLLTARGALYDVAEEVTQWAWARGFQKLDQLRDNKDVLVWVNSIAMNKFHSEIRSPWWGCSVQLSSLQEEPKAGLEINISIIDLNLILELCQKKADRKLISMKLQGLLQSEIAEALQTSEVAIRIRWCRLMRFIRTRLEERRETRSNEFKKMSQEDLT